MTCPRCLALLVVRDPDGRSCLICGHVEYESVIEEWRAREEVSGKFGRRAHPPMRAGFRL